MKQDKNKRKSEKRDEKSDTNRKLDGLLILSAVDNLSGEEKLKILTSCIGLREAARIIGRDPSNFTKSLKKLGKNGKGRE